MIISKDQLVNNIVTEISDNSTGQISPYDVRHNLLDIVDSVHLLLLDKDIQSNNIGSLDTRTTKLGLRTIENIVADNAISEDNTAVGYSALKSNYQGLKNTAIGSSALSCNVYGENNVAIGYQALTANSTGDTNVAIGNYSLQSNKWGYGNVGIGHAAGYYIGRNTSNKLFIASHPIDSGYICANPLGSGLTPLVYGDFSDQKFGIAVSNLHNDGTLQVSGAITPSDHSSYNLGSSNYNFQRLYLSNGVTFPSGNLDYSYALSGISSSQNIIPLSDDTYNLGTFNNRWSVGYFNEVVSNIYTTIETCKYACKTLYLASSGACEADNPCGYLSDSELENAGFLIQASGSSYLRNYFFQFKPENSDLTNLEIDNVYSRSSWNSNISLHLDSGCHIKTDRVLSSGHLAMVTQPEGLGLFIRDGIFSLIEEDLYDLELSGSGNVNFIAQSGQTDDYIITYGTVQSGVSISQRFLSDIENKDGNNLEGFQLKYFDDSTSDQIISSQGTTDRFVISSYHDTEDPINSLVLLKDSGGTLCINNFDAGGDYLIPNTILNIRSINDSVIRSTSEVQGNYKSALQLVGHENCLNSGIEVAYYNINGIADISLYKDLNKESFIVMLSDESKMGFFASSGDINELITIGNSDYSKSVISLYETSQTVTATDKYGKLYVKEKVVGSSQSSSIYFMDYDGNEFDLIFNTSSDENGLLYTDSNRNTLGGIGCNFDRDFLTSQNHAFDNVGLGYTALNLLASGSRNIAIGSYVMDNLVSGSENIAIGFGAMESCGEYIRNNIVIGQNYLGRDLETNDTLLLGYGGYPIISGNLRFDNRHLFLPDGKLSIESSDGTEKLFLKNNTIEVIDYGGDDYPQNQLDFKFTGNETVTLLTLKNSGVPLDTVATYEFADSGIPYAELNGDLRLQNAIRFSDGTSLYSAPSIDSVSGIANDNANRLNQLVIEGISQDLIGIGQYDAPTSGIIKTRDNTNVFVSNRDQYLEIGRNDYVIAIKIGQEYRPLWVSSDTTTCQCCGT